MFSSNIPKKKTIDGQYTTKLFLSNNPTYKSAKVLQVPRKQKFVQVTECWRSVCNAYYVRSNFLVKKTSTVGDRRKEKARKEKERMKQSMISGVANRMKQEAVADL